ncbi:replication initiation protein [Mesorhizobium sp. ES1-4]|uniref:replication initiation protein n=1 Tax=Mesorhizobium sp. ES1-4 TaxID=2876627 RepID=UPI001CCB3B74|nr:replication initiation protein [Mesorhizobium sp. ES1-4]MBZ9798726.1 replication initiation protein [Mesorhizobium sp. ES1-4]
MIETLRFRNDVLTAKDKALYEMMLAYARMDGIEKPRHSIAVADLSKFVDVKNLDRLVESLERISDVKVTYDFVEDGERCCSKHQLIVSEVREQLSTGVAHLSYSIPEAIRKVILASRDYAMLEINAFSKFKCRYTSMLYQRLAYRAGMDAAVRKPWAIEPAKLAEELGYPMKNFSFGVFRRDVLLPALADMASPNITRFTVKMDAPRGSGRGRSVKMITFRVTDTWKRMEERRAATLSPQGMKAIRQADATLGHDELPSNAVVARAVTATGIDEITLSDGWRAAYERAKADPKGEAFPGLESWMLLDAVKKSGVGAGFYMFAEAAAEASVIPTNRLPVKAAPAAAEQAPVRTVRTPEETEARQREIAAKFAGDILDQLAGFHSGREFKASFAADHFVRHCDHEIAPWACAADYMQEFSLLSNALRALRRVDDATRRRSLSNLAYAIKAWDFYKLTQIAGAVVKSSKAGTAMTPPPAPGRIHRLKGFIPTRQLTEASAEYDFVDPAYAAGAVQWDDRAEVDMRPSDDACPF